MVRYRVKATSITMCVLLISNKDDITTDCVVNSLHKRKVPFYRLNTEEIGTSVFLNLDISKERYTLYDAHLDKEFDLKGFKSVYYRRPVIPKFDAFQLSTTEQTFLSRECWKVVEGLCKLLSSAFWISPLSAIREAENKIWQLKVAKEIGFCIPDSVITNTPSHFNAFMDRNNHDCVVKALSSARLGKESDEIAFTHKLEQSYDEQTIKLCPSYLQHNIHRDYDVRVIVIGTEVYAFSIRPADSNTDFIDWRAEETPLKYECIVVPEKVSRMCRCLVEKMNLSFGAIDLIKGIDESYYFLEINSNGQWAWLEAETGVKLSDKIADLLEHGKN